MSLEHLTNALNIGQRELDYHCAVEDAELTLKAAIKMQWLKSKGLDNRSKHLCWFQNIESRIYDKLTFNRLNVVLELFKKVLISPHEKDVTSLD